MPTDEQRMREQFEKWAETESFDLTANIHTGKYIYSDTLTAWLTWQARDAEVQALKRVMLELIECAEEASDRLKPPSGPLDFAIFQARAALAGEGGDSE